MSEEIRIELWRKTLRISILVSIPVSHPLFAANSLFFFSALLGLFWGVGRSTDQKGADSFGSAECRMASGGFGAACSPGMGID